MIQTQRRKTEERYPNCASPGKSSDKKPIRFDFFYRKSTKQEDHTTTVNDKKRKKIFRKANNLFTHSKTAEASIYPNY